MYCRRFHSSMPTHGSKTGPGFARTVAASNGSTAAAWRTPPSTAGRAVLVAASGSGAAGLICAFLGERVAGAALSW
jgi:hypothetical protein